MASSHGDFFFQFCPVCQKQVIAWSRVKLGINITRVFRTELQKLPSSCTTRAISFQLENTCGINP